MNDKAWEELQRRHAAEIKFTRDIARYYYQQACLCAQRNNLPVPYALFDWLKEEVT